MGLISNGSTIFDNGSMASGFGGSMVFIKKLTASASATLSFVDGSDGVVLDDTYKEYVFYFVNMHPATDTADFTFNMSTDGGSNYNVTKTTTQFRAVHNEADTATSLAYEGDADLAQGTGFQILFPFVGSDNDQSCSGYLHLFNPSSTTYVKHFICMGNRSQAGDYTANDFTAGYGNTTSAINAVKFQMSSGNIDAGQILLFGIN